MNTNHSVQKRASNSDSISGRTISNYGIPMANVSNRTKTLSDDTGASAPVAHGDDDKAWFSENFFSKEPSLSRARALYLKIVFGTSFMIVVFIMAVLPIYWGALWKVPSHVHNLKGWIVDFDGAQMGQFVTQAFISSSGAPTRMTWEVVSPDRFPNGQADMIDLLVHEHTWAIVSINPGATNSFNSSIVSVNGSYNGSSAVTIYTEEARSENAYNQIIKPNVETVMKNASSIFAASSTSQLALGGRNLSNLAINAPELLSAPLYYTVYNTRPFDVPVAAAVDFVGLIYLLIVAFVTSLVNTVARTDVTHIEDRLRFRSLMLARAIVPILIYFYLSCFFSMISLAFQVPFNRTFGHSGFVIYWMLSWLAMCALGLAVEAMVTLITVRFIPFFLILWIIANVSVCFMPIPVLPRVYRYGYAMPFYNVQRAVRAIVFNTKNDLGLNFGVLIAWSVISLMTMTLFQYMARRRAIKQRVELT